MKKRSSYWKRRTLLAERRANALGRNLNKEYEKMYVRSYNRINREIERLAAKATVSTDALTQSELYDYGRMINLREIIEDEFTGITIAMQTKAEATLAGVYKATMVGAAKDFGMEFIMPNEFQIKAVVNEVYKGSNYSERIWTNNNALASRVQVDMERMVMQGRSPQTISKQLQRDFNVGYSNADRLVRTESSRVYNAAREASYKEFGIEKVEFLAEGDACDICTQHGGKTFNMGSEPEIPVHPNCRCAYAPIVE